LTGGNRGSPEPPDILDKTVATKARSSRARICKIVS
jgi:hypothetical protein